MNKRDAIRLFGSTVTELASALGLTRSAVSQWPERLRQAQADRVMGAAVRLGRVRIAEDSANDSNRRAA